MNRGQYKRLKIALIQAGISRKNLSKKTGIPPNYVSLIATGRLTPTEKQRVRIAEALGCSPDELFPPGKEVA